MKLDIPGYQVHEERRTKGKRGGIAILIRKGVKVLKYMGNEYAQGVCIQVQGGDTIWVGNVYLPPIENMLRRGMDEDLARDLIEDITGAIPAHSQSIMCGDWNTRIGQLYPKIGDTDIQRVSLDPIISSRAPWVIQLCELHGWYILNGLQPGPPAIHTFERGTGQSCIDLIMTPDPTQAIEYDPDTLKGLSDHVLVQTTMKMPQLQVLAAKRSPTRQPEIIYKWVEGTCVSNYAKSA